MRPFRKGRSWSAAAVVAGIVAFRPLAAENPKAPTSGHFCSGNVSLEMRGAYAFWWKSASPIDDPEPMLRVAVANSAIDPAYFDRFFDRLHAINARFADEEYRVVYFEFTSGGKYHGLSFYFGSGNGCGYCYDPEVRSTVRLAAGRLAGHLEARDDKHPFDIDLDVAVPPREWGKPLPAGGGDAGKVYAKYEAALEARDVAAARTVLDERLAAFWQKVEKEGTLDRYIDYLWKEKHLEMKSPAVTGGFVKGDRAVLFLEGRSSYAPVRGEAVFHRENGSWRFSDELLRVD